MNLPNSTCQATESSTTLLHYDLHTHTTASDGELSPTELVMRAYNNGVNVLAITDHDTITGLAEAHKCITDKNIPVTLINGVEISTAWNNFDIHIVGLHFDLRHKSIADLLSEQKQRRQRRAEEIAHQLAKKNIPNALEGATRIAQGAELTRTHFARYLVEIDRATSIANVFKHYLAKGKIGYVPPQWCSVKDAIEAIHSAGGKAVLAHPDRYNLSAKWLRRLLAEFSESGGDGIEVAYCRQAPDERAQLVRYAKEYHLLASQGSDFHRPEQWQEIGRGYRLPEGLSCIWENW